MFIKQESINKNKNSYKNFTIKNQKENNKKNKRNIKNQTTNKTTNKPTNKTTNKSYSLQENKNVVIQLAKIITSKTIFHLLLKIVVISLIIYLSYSNIIDKLLKNDALNNINNKSNKSSNPSKSNKKNNGHIRYLENLELIMKKNIIISIISIICILIIYLIKNKCFYQDDLLLILILAILNISNVTNSNNLKNAFDFYNIDSFVNIRDTKDVENMIEISKMEVPAESDLVYGSNKPEHYDFTPDDLPTFELEKSLKKYKKILDEDKNNKYLQSVKPYVKDELDEIHPNYNPLNKPTHSISTESEYVKLNNAVLNSLNDYYENENLFKDKNQRQDLKSIKNIVPGTKYRKNNGVGKCKYEQIGPDDDLNKTLTKNLEKFNPNPILDEYDLLSDKKNPNLYSLSKQSFYDQHCTNFPEVTDKNLELINDNTAKDIQNNNPKKSFIAFTDRQYDIGSSNIINVK